MPKNQNYVNHIALVLDASSSMWRHRGKVVEVADAQIAHLARRSKDLNQETRVTVYTFADNVSCEIYDKDVLRLPSLRGHYQPNGMTALIDATLQSQEDLSLTPEIYGDHAFLTFVITDGQENRSKRNPNELVRYLERMPSHWTMAFLVPDQLGKHEVKQLGVPAENIAVWDATTASGVEEGFKTIRQATETFMTNRASGIRGSRSVFSTGSDAVNSDTIKDAGLVPLSRSKYQLIPVNRKVPIRDFVTECGYRFSTGSGFYELSKAETIQTQKKVAVLEKKTDRVYMGDEARSLIGLPDVNVQVKPNHNDNYTIFVQSTSVNRKLIPGTRLLLMMP